MKNRIVALALMFVFLGLASVEAPAGEPTAPITKQSDKASPKLLVTPLPNPAVVFTGSEKYQVNGQNFVRYKLSVTNYAAYPNAMFAPAANLPPCGNNKNSSRT